MQFLIHAKTRYGGGTPTLFNFESMNTLLGRERTAVESRQNRRESRENRRMSRENRREIERRTAESRETTVERSRGEPPRDRERRGEIVERSGENRRDRERRGKCSQIDFALLFFFRPFATWHMSPQDATEKLLTKAVPVLIACFSFIYNPINAKIF